MVTERRSASARTRREPRPARQQPHHRQRGFNILIEHAVVAVHFQQIAHLLLGEAEHVVELRVQADVLANVEAAGDVVHGDRRYAGDEHALQTAAAAFRRALNPEALDRLTFVPVPPSKAKGDPLYDDRLTRMLRAIRPEPPLDVRELIVQTESTDAVHDREVRPRPEEIEALYSIDQTLTEPAPRLVAVVDDLLTTGAHFRAAKSILSARFPEVAVVGMFIARRAPDTADLEEFDDVEF